MKTRAFAPILIPTLNRYEHFKRCVESLSKCNYSDQSILVVGLDYPPSLKYREGYEKIKKYLLTIKGFKEVVILETNENIGVQANCNRLYNYVREQGYDRYIFSEDDNEFAGDFLEYVNWGLEEYKNDESIYAICGFKDIETGDIANNVYKLNNVFSAWGFGSWFNRLDKKNRFNDHNLLISIVNNASLLSVFSKEVFRYVSLLDQVRKKQFHGDMLVSLLPDNEKWCIFPKVNMVRNWGQDGSGVHGGAPEALKKYISLPLDENEHFVPVVVEDLYNPIIYNRFREEYKKPFKRRVKAAVVFLIYKMTGRILIIDNKKWHIVKLQKAQ